MGFPGPLRFDPFRLRTVRSLEFSLVDSLVDPRLFPGNPHSRWIIQTRDFLQVRMPDRPIQLCRIDHLSTGSESAESGGVHRLPDERLYSWKTGAGEGTDRDPARL